MENIGLVGLSRQVALQRELDVIANNIANLNTTGFKQDDVVFHEYLMPVARDDTFQRGGDRRLSFVWDRATATNMGQGAMEATGNTLDVGISGRGLFAVQTPEGERYTRNGSFEINSQNQLVTKQGQLVLGEGGPISFETTDVGITISRDGTISARDGTATGPAQTRGRLRLVEANGRGSLQKAGDNLFSLTAGAQVQPVTDRDLRQGFVEKSNVTPVLALSRMIEVTRAYQSLASSIERHDQLRRDAIRSLGSLT
ncbi:MAG: flagellar basal-body rod protein FlgF [Phreatobacter sp.]|uniref:flagellar basal-body rod protein FlgF n=1 Tax=Phreatobacter sp. TaxID=1966341 RepID=UPI001A409E74|nr:flagellar basal-body rod protein FlgF [Phreatobacter sp.]MBL8571086.1 flagellar basal-body rod protein FlgF [Phreatobacter sp.]